VAIAWREVALDDLECLRSFIAGDNPRAAARVVSTIFDAIELLAEQPGLGRPGRVPSTREWVVADTPYVVAYRVKDKVVEILRVLHAARKWPRRIP
jgi:toxin ParE1/3/4